MVFKQDGEKLEAAGILLSFLQNELRVGTERGKEGRGGVGGKKIR